MIKEVKTRYAVVVFTKEIIAESVDIHPNEDFAGMLNLEIDKPHIYLPMQS